MLRSFCALHRFFWSSWIWTDFAPGGNAAGKKKEPRNFSRLVSFPKLLLAGQRVLCKHSVDHAFDVLQESALLRGRLWRIRSEFLSQIVPEHG